MRYLCPQMAMGLFALFAAAVSSPGPLRILLSAETEVPGDSILLIDLLPKNVSQHWRTAAGNASLGLAPQSGATRFLDRQAVLAAMETAGLPPSAFAIPGTISVRRASRLLTPADTYSAIQTALANNSLGGISFVLLENIELEAAVRVPGGDPLLLVTQTVFDPFIRRARFRLRSRAFSGILPFYVTARVPHPPSGPASSVRLRAASFAPTLQNLPALAPVLVKPGRTALLHLHSPNSSTLLTVQPLQLGRLGDTIRVRTPGRAKTLQARVIAGDSLDAAF